LSQGKDSHISCNDYLPGSVQARDLLKELIPGELRVASHEGVELAFLSALQAFENTVGNGFLYCHLDCSLFRSARGPIYGQRDIGGGTAETEESIA
jgi:hypothetical protein